MARVATKFSEEQKQEISQLMTIRNRNRREITNEHKQHLLEATKIRRAKNLEYSADLHFENGMNNGFKYSYDKILNDFFMNLNFLIFRLHKLGGEPSMNFCLDYLEYKLERKLDYCKVDLILFLTQYIIGMKDINFKYPYPWKFECLTESNYGQRRKLTLEYSSDGVRHIKEIIKNVTLL